MQPQEIKSLIESSMSTQLVETEAEGSHVKITVVSKDFDGLNTLKRQQKIYALLQDAISSGAIHAVHMKTFTPDQWATQGA